jgi:putative aminopeptidase FrvX
MMATLPRLRVAAILVLNLAGTVAPDSALAAQSAVPLQRWISSWQELVAPTGHEERAIVALLGVLKGWQRDAVGNLMLRRGSGTPRRVIACALDRPGFAVTQITDDGYLRVHRVGGGGHPLFDQAHEAQQMNIHTSAGPVPGVMAIANGHFAPQHRGDTAIVTADDLWLDVGAASRAEVEALGVRLLDPVDRRLPAWAYASGVAGVGVGARAGCAAIAAAAHGTVERGETIYLMTTQSVFGWTGLGGALARLGPVDEVTVTGHGAGFGVNRVIARIANVDSVRVIVPRVRYAGTLVETMTYGDVQQLLAEVEAAAGVPMGSAASFVSWVSAPPAASPPARRAADSHAETAAMLKRLADLPGAPGHEQRVRNALRAAMPAWAQSASMTDGAGNLIVGAGPERDTVVFIAHMDEVAWEITAIARDGEVSLRALGGVVASAWEGQPAMTFVGAGSHGNADEPMLGVFVPRSDPRGKRPPRLTAWFGYDSAMIVGMGLRVGEGVTAYKDAVRLAGRRFTGRAMDDRAGSLALLRALGTIDPSKLTRRVLFVWSTQEEGGLVGATALAARIGRNVKRVHSIDTFVSSDTPLESPHFAFARLGEGPVLRGIENSSMVPPAARAEIERIAREAGIPLQVGQTQGGTDGTAFTFYGAPNVPLSWPGRYSHAPGEVLDLRDVERLGALIAAIAMSP